MGHAIPDYGWSHSNATGAHDYIWPAIRQLMPSTPGAKLRVLDIGCGNGWVAGHLAELGHEVTAIEPSATGIEFAKAQYPRVSFFNLSVYDDLSPLGLGCFDLVVSSEVIEHLYRPRVLVERSFEFLTRGGSLILTTPFHGYWKNLAISVFNKWDSHFTVERDGGHIKFFSEKTLTTLLKGCGFVDVRFSNAGRLPGLWKSMIAHARKPARPV
jgi:2-polyprenyl-3-methyl-5-hydroxy-6-metoxy-1,4-benzoquinol methylase